MQDSDNKNFALYDEVNEVVNEDLGEPGDLNDLFVDLDAAPAELLEGNKDFGKKDEDADALAEIDLSPGALDKSNDSVRIYLREMGMVPLLTREGEIELAKQIEHGQAAVRKSLSRSRLVLQLLLDNRQNIEQDKLCITDVLQSPDLAGFPHEEEDLKQSLKQQFFTAMDEIEKMFRRAQQIQQKLFATSRATKPKPHRELRFQ